MRRFWISVPLALGLFAAAAAQPPDKKKADPPPDKKKVADPVDAAVAAALANDPDVKVARAKVQLAEAELAKAKQAIVLRVMTLNASVREYRQAVDVARQQFAIVEALFMRATVPQSDVLRARLVLEQTQATLTRAETELKLITGGGGPAGVGSGGDPDTAANHALRWLTNVEAGEDAKRVTSLLILAGLEAYREAHGIKGPIPDRIRAALDKPVKLGAKGETVTFEKAMEVFKKDAGLDVPVRGPGDLIRSPEIVSQGEELPVGAWFQLFQDYSGATIFVRDYGLLFTAKSAAPPDAPTLTEFWKQKPPAEKKPAPEKK